MPKVRVDMLIQDRNLGKPDDKLTEHYDIVEPFFADGPVTRRLAVIDFDPVTNALLPPLRVIPPRPPKKLYFYEGHGTKNLTSREFLALNAFGLVNRTMKLYEDASVLGRPLRWGFEGPQLFILPRAGTLENAYYERASRSLQFFSFQGEEREIFLSLSRDIVAHETAHAILDGVAPDLYNALTPQSLAIHEAIADVTALLIALASGTLRDQELARTGGSIAQRTAFSNVAEEFAQTRDPARKGEALRQLKNDKSLDLVSDNHVASTKPHRLSEVLTGALYELLVTIHEGRTKQFKAEGLPSDQASARALGVATSQFGSIVLRALDYLPPGEVTFADLGRAILASDKASFPDATAEPAVIRQEFLRRAMARSAADLEVEDLSTDDTFLGQDLGILLESDWAAYEFAHRNRALFRAPKTAPLYVRRRLDVTKTYRHREGEVAVRELIFKVSWDHREDNERGLGLPTQRQISVGTTVAVDRVTKRIRARVSSGALIDIDTALAAKADRDAQLRAWVREDRLQLGPSISETVDGPPSMVRGEVNDDLLRIRTSLHQLHLEGGR